MGKAIANQIVQSDIEATINKKRAREIMGENFFGVEDWSKFYGVDFSKKQLREVIEFPWGEDILNAPCPFVKGKGIRETHFAFLGLKAIGSKPLTITRWEKLHPSPGQPRFRCYYPGNWFEKKKFANEPTCGFRWYLMLLEIVPNSTHKPYKEQVAMLPAEYEVPFAIEEVSKNFLLYYKQNFVYLHPLGWGRCQDVAWVGHRVHINRSVNHYSIPGGLASIGLGVGCGLSSDLGWEIGLAASRKSPYGAKLTIGQV
ncbi:MAG: hypothetical protein ABH813_00250 [Patescibacteria group bacterium]